MNDDVLGDIHDLNEKERAQTFKRWVDLSELVAPRTADEQGDRPEY